ncbi:hypothetical protein [Motiliproteus coralliicola]|uniref:hypothetical protein n=1 Tax=Motiliproteus coralliicola TaxID=2283196 RepID=UPI001403EA92|nr:hypothetical protein [Motiliproteus coralliicola]
MKSYQFFTAEGRGGTMLCDDETLADAVAELQQRFKQVVKVQYGKEVWEAPATATGSEPSQDSSESAPT